MSYHAITILQLVITIWEEEHFPHWFSSIIWIRKKVMGTYTCDFSGPRRRCMRKKGALLINK